MVKQVIEIAEFPRDGRLWRIDWLAAVQRNVNVPTESTIEVYLRPVEKNTKANFGVNNQERVCCLIGVGQLPLLAVGSLWHDGRLLEDRAINRRTVLEHVHINSNTVQLINAGHKDGEHYVINKFSFDIGGYQNGLNANCLAIRHYGDPYRIIIPVSEIIRFYYAASSDMAKIAFSGMYENDFDEIVGELHYFNPELKRFIIQLRYWIEDNDGWTLARLLQEPCADEAFKMIHRSLVKQSVNAPHKRTMPETNFPFEGRTDLTARCLEFNSGGKSRLLVLELLHCTAPFPFADLEVVRDNDGTKANPDTDIPDDDKIECWASRDITKQNSDGLPLQSEAEAYRFATKQSITLKANRFGALAGKQIIKTAKDQCKYKAAQLILSQSTEATALGTGFGTTGDSTIIPAQIMTAEDEERIRRQREKALEASFEAMIEAVGFLNQYPKTTAVIRQSSNGYFVPLTSPKNFQWAYLDSKRKLYRSVLVADIQVNDRYFWLIEFELRKGEHFTSALVEIPEHYSDGELLQLLKGLAGKNGIWRNIKHRLDFKIIPMKHTWNSAEGYASSVYERSVLNN